MSKNQLIVQLPVTESTDFDALIYIEELLIQTFSQDDRAQVDGHDIGDGRFNIVIVPSASWESVIETVKGILKLRGVLNEALIVKRLESSERYVVVWPEQYSGEFEF